MILHGFKGGTGTASRVVRHGDDEYRVGVLVQGNTGTRPELRIAGVPVGQELLEYGVEAMERPATKSIIIVVATDAPVDPHYLERIAKRPVLGMGRLGNTGHDTSGDIFIAFSTASPGARVQLEEPESCPRCRSSTAGWGRPPTRSGPPPASCSRCSSRPPWRPPKRPSSTRWSRPRTCAGATTASSSRSRTTSCARRCASTTGSQTADTA